MTAAAIAARVRRLDQLSRGLALEISTVSKAEDPRLYLEVRSGKETRTNDNKRGSNCLRDSLWAGGKRNNGGRGLAWVGQGVASGIGSWSRRSLLLVYPGLAQVIR